MKVRRKIRKGLALFLALAVIFTMLAEDIRITRAEESGPADLGSSGSICEEDVPEEESGIWFQEESKESPQADTGEEPEEDFPGETEESGEADTDEEPGKDGPEETEEGVQADTGEEPEEGGPEETGEGVQADTGEEPEEGGPEETGEDVQADTGEEPEEDFPEELIDIQADADEEPEEDLGNEFDKKLQVKDADYQEGVSSDEPSEISGEKPEETSVRNFLANQPMAAAEEISYPVYVTAPTITIEGSVNGSVQNRGIRQRTDLEQGVGETFTSQHCPLHYTSCSYCKTDIYIATPFLYGAVYASVSDSSIIRRKEYISGDWTEDHAIGNAGCLHVNYEAKKPGIADVKVYYYVRYQKHADAKGRCPLCRWLMPAVNRNTWYKYEDDFKIHVYADYTLRYDANAGMDSVRNMPRPLTERKAASAVEMEVTDLVPVREGYKFLGWAEKKDAIKESYKANDPVTLRWKTGSDAEKTLYAVWEKNVQYGSVTEDIKYSEPNLTVIKRACRPDTVTPVASVETGETYSYVITVKNNAKSKVKHLQISELLDMNLIQLLNNPTDYKNGIWTIECLNAEETVSLILHVKAISESPGYENIVHVMAVNAYQELTEIPPRPDDIRSAVVEIRGAPDLIIQKTVDKARAGLNDMLTYTITVKNPSEISKALDVRIRDQLPESLQWMGAFIRKDQEISDNMKEHITVLEHMPEDGEYKIGDLGAGETVMLTLMAKVLKADEGITNLASARKGTGPEVYDSAYTEMIPSQSDRDPEDPQDPAPEPPKDPQNPSPESPEEPQNPVPELPEEHQEPVPEPPEELSSPSSDRGAEDEGGASIRTEETVLISEREGDEVPVTETPSARPAAVEIISERQPEAEEKTADLKQEPSGDTVAEPDISSDVSDPGVPLAAHGHLCCILHLVIMLLALIMELFYMRSMKKHQSRIFEMRKKLKETEK